MDANEVQIALSIKVILSLNITFMESSRCSTSLCLLSISCPSFESLGLILASCCEHLCTIGPSTALSSYSSIMLIIELARFDYPRSLSGVDILIFLKVSKVLIQCIHVVLESSGKRALLKTRFQDSTYEDTSNYFAKALMLWLKPVLSEGTLSETAP